jgi:transketolase N-terminal domain/subunit
LIGILGACAAVHTGRAGATRINHWRTNVTSTVTTNEGTLDRGLRIAAGLALIALAATGAVGVWGYIGVVPLLTGALGVCLLYSMLGINTCPVRR